jgi:GNAT superfamily N-acetyltransferase
MQPSGEILAGATVRKYSPADRAAARRICYETGLMGDSIDPYFGCLDLFADFWTLYYTDYEPESTFVAEADGQVIGYLMGCTDTKVQQRIQKREIMPRIRRRLMTFGYRVDRRFLSFMWRQLRSTWRGELAHGEEEYIMDYPAHLHMNLAEGYRSGGIGSMLLSAYLDYLRTSNVTGLHLGTTSYNKLAVPFYKKWGFQIAARYPLTLYEGIIPEKVEILFFTREVK